MTQKERLAALEARQQSHDREHDLVFGTGGVGGYFGGRLAAAVPPRPGRHERQRGRDVAGLVAGGGPASRGGWVRRMQVGQ